MHFGIVVFCTILQCSQNVYKQRSCQRCHKKALMPSNAYVHSIWQLISNESHYSIFVFLSWFIKFYITAVNTNTLVMLAPEKCNKLWGLRLIDWQIFFFVCIFARLITKKEGMNVRKCRAVRSFVCALGLSIIYRSATQCKKNVTREKPIVHPIPVLSAFILCQTKKKIPFLLILRSLTVETIFKTISGYL